ncbi:MAG: hypothetical protein EXX96DRAFT_603791 [Benjaminiella poitrasii]|nr:MAG: hypothetical protein EXX96DRAFT_603791 [Benjaminiella poitrasii]
MSFDFRDKIDGTTNSSPILFKRSSTAIFFFVMIWKRKPIILGEFSSSLKKTSCYDEYVKVEDYRRTNKDINSSHDEKPSADNEVRISHSKIPVYLDACLKLLQEEHKNHIIVIGKGLHVNKAVTVVEMVKRKMQGTLHQYTQIGSVSVVEQWDPINDKDLDSVQVNKKVPVIIIYLSLEEIPELEATSGHQAPTGPDIFD